MLGQIRHHLVCLPIILMTWGFNATAHSQVATECFTCDSLETRVACGAGGSDDCSSATMTVAGYCVTMCSDNCLPVKVRRCISPHSPGDLRIRNTCADFASMQMFALCRRESLAFPCYCDMFDPNTDFVIYPCSLEIPYPSARPCTVSAD